MSNKISSPTSEIDHLAWKAGMALIVHGVRVGIRTNHPSVCRQLRPYFPPASKPALSRQARQLYSVLVTSGNNQGDGRRCALYSGSSLITDNVSVGQLGRILESHMQSYIAEAAPQRLFVHAGVVGLNGRAVVIPGRSRSGKTTLVKALVLAGATYYSDEYAVFDRRGRVHPYAKPLGIRAGRDDVPERCPIERLGRRAGLKPLPVDRVLVTRYVRGAQWRPRKLSAARAVLALMAHTIVARSRPDFAMATLKRAIYSAQALEGKRGEAEDLVEALLPTGIMDQAASRWKDGEQWLRRIINRRTSHAVTTSKTGTTDR